MKKLGLLMLALATFWVAAACGGDDGFTSYAPTQVVGDLTADEYVGFCEDGQAYLRTQISDSEGKKAACIVLALSFSDGLEDCQSTYDGCLAAPAEPNQPEPCTDDRGATCTATVEEFENCANDAVQYAKDLAKLTCADVDSPLLEGPASTAACEAVETKCPLE